MKLPLVGVVTAIGGGFYRWGEFNTRLSAIEGAGVDISGISKNAEEIAVINEKIGKLDLSGIAVVEEIQKQTQEAIDENEEWIEEVEGKVGKNKERQWRCRKEMQLKRKNYSTI